MSTPQLVLFASAAVFGTAGVVFASSYRRRAVAFATVILLTAIAAGLPAYAAFSSAPSGHSAPAPPITVGAASLPTPSLASPACTYTGQSALHVDWTALAASYSWAAGFQVKRSTNGGAYSDYGSQVTPYSATSATDSSVTSPASNTYTYKVRSQAGTNWNSSDSAVASSATCAGRISTLGQGAATSQIHLSDAVAVDSSGNVAISDNGGNRVQYIAAATGTWFNISMTAGYMYTIAGTGVAGSTGDGAAGTSAKLNGPEGIAFDASGNIYVADAGSQDIRVITKSGCTCFGRTITAGQIDRVAGSQASLGNTGDGGAARSATLWSPHGVAIDSGGNLIISDTNNHRIRMVPADANNHYNVTMGTANNIYNIAGNSGGTSGSTGDGGAATSGFLNAPQQIALDTSDNLFIADTGNRTVRKVTTGGTISKIAGTAGSSGATGDGGVATSAKLSTTESGVSVDSSGNIYIADGSNAEIRAVCPSVCTIFGKAIAAGNIDTVVGTGTGGYTGEGYPVLASKLSGPSGVFFDRTGGTLYIADSNNDYIRKVSASYNLYAIAGNGTAAQNDAVLAAGASLVTPEGVAVDSSGNVYIADKSDNRIRKYIASTGEIATIAGTGVAGATGDGGASTSAKVNAPEGVAVDANGVVYVADTGSNKIRAICPSGGSNCTVLNVSINAGNIDTVAGGSTIAGVCGDDVAATNSLCKLTGPKGVDVDSSLDLFIADTGNNQIRWVPNTTSTSNNYGYVATNATQYKMYTVKGSLGAPTDIAVDSSRNVYLSDTSNNRIKSVEPVNGTVVTIAGNGSAGHCASGSAATGACANAPTGVAINGAADTVYFVNAAGTYLEKVPFNGGNVTTLAGTGSAGLTGDGGGAPGGGAAIAAFGVAVRASGGNIFIAGGTSSNIQLRQILGPL